MYDYSSHFIRENRDRQTDEFVECGGVPKGTKALAVSMCVCVCVCVCVCARVYVSTYLDQNKKYMATHA
jgi:hypothetical protein